VIPRPKRLDEVLDEHTTVENDPLATYRKFTGSGNIYSQEGNPIPRDLVVRVELVDSSGNVTESREFKREDDADELIQWIGEYAVSMACEGMAGSVRWTESREAGEDER
jgi:hypothetical protein